jgi:hypothetical protein
MQAYSLAGGSIGRFASLAGNHLATDGRFRNLLFADEGNPSHAASRSAPGFHLYLDPQLVTGNDWTAKARSLSSRIAPACAMDSIIMTPGTIGISGK